MIARILVKYGHFLNYIPVSTIDLMRYSRILNYIPLRVTGYGDAAIF